MNFTAEEAPVFLHSRLSWNASPPALVSGSDPWLRASRRLIDGVRDERGYSFPLRDELWVTVYPPQENGYWRAVGETVGSAVVGRGLTSEEALRDWRKRFRMTIESFLEMRPFEMTEEDKDLWTRIQAVIDVPRYKATKPMIFKQVGKVYQIRGVRVKIEWEDGLRETVDPNVFDEAFSRFRVGQPFEVVVTRHPLTFRLIRADALRRLPADRPVSQERSNAIWERAVGSPKVPTLQTGEIDEDFWLSTPE